MADENRELEITCPRNPDHGKVLIRWLQPRERERITSKSIADVFEITCPKCGKYEISDPHLVEIIS
jgi:hypothetical protein